VGPPALRRRIKIEHLGGRARTLERRWRRRGFVSLRAKVAQGAATAARAYLFRRVRGKLALVASSRRAVRLTTRARTLRLAFVRHAPRVARGRYLTVVSATIAGELVTRARPLRLR
jgi:hypothetical protein